MNQQLFSGKGFVSAGFLNLSPRDVYAEATENGAVLLDVREPELIGAKRFDVPDVFYLPISELNEKIDQIPRNVPLIVADSSGIKSHEAMVLLMKEGFTNAANLAGGLVEWDRDGLPLVIDYDNQLSGSCICQLHPINRLKKNKL